MLNILQLCAGKGSRFANLYPMPKPLIDVRGNPMFKVAINCFAGLAGRRHFLFQEKDYLQYNPQQYVDGVYHIIDHYTTGAATSAAHVIRNSEYLNEPWLITDCDSMIDFDFKQFAKMSHRGNCVFTQHKPFDIKSSYSCIDNNNNILGIAEKQTISEYRNTGQYHWQSGETFINAYDFYVENNLMSLGEYYIAPLYNHAIQVQHSATVSVPVYNFTPVGVPEDLERYLNAF
jgi:NDP-sugar pyrophosphorylase family protein